MNIIEIKLSGNLKKKLAREIMFAWIFFLMGLPMVSAQIYYDKGKNRYTFAQTTVGYDFDFTPSLGRSYFINDQNQLEKFKFRDKITPVITITGLHFWGHAEFFTGFSLLNIAFGKAATDYVFKRSAGTGAKFFPWALRANTLRPFLGFSIAGFKYKKEEAATYRRVEYPLLFGLTYSFHHGMIELGGAYYYANRYDYYITRSQQVSLYTPPLSFNVDFKYYIDFSMASYKRDLNGENQRIMETLKNKRRRSSFFLAAGPAYSFILGRSSYNKEVRPYLDDYKITSVFPDLGLGYYHYGMDAAANLSSRFYSATLSGHGVEQKVRRTSFGIELYKFIGDYHGFVPFVGPIISSESIVADETENGVKTIHKHKNFIAAGIIAGWDIRPTRTDWWGIRTNIRYYPGLSVAVDGPRTINLQQIELNFLQLVIYPNRFTAYRKVQ